MSGNRNHFTVYWREVDLKKAAELYGKLLIARPDTLEESTAQDAYDRHVQARFGGNADLVTAAFRLGVAAGRLLERAKA